VHDLQRWPGLRQLAGQRPGQRRLIVGDQRGGGGAILRLAW
jgi:hypothetical protein